MKAKKSFGQHFLINESAAEKIVNSLELEEKNQRVLEIGPGKGVLTKYLLQKNIDLRVVEADSDMVEYLEREYVELQDKIIFLDFLKLNLKKVFDGHSFLLIGNYPYNISSQIIFRMLKYRNLIPQMVGMFQKEVADRIIAPHGSKTYGILSVLTQAYYTGKMVMKISPGSFSPPPNVNSAVIKLDRKENYELPCDDRLFRTVVKLTFGQRRKMLRNTVKTLIQDPTFLDDDFLKNRPEQLSLEQFIHLTTLIEEHIREQKRKEE